MIKFQYGCSECELQSENAKLKELLKKSQTAFSESWDIPMMLELNQEIDKAIEVKP